MLYDYLYEFTVVAQEGSFTKAARALSLSQPSIARHISALETHLGTRLFDRHAHGLSLTEEGRYALTMALDLVEAGQSIDDYFAQLRNSRQAAEDTREIIVAGATSSKQAISLFHNAFDSLDLKSKNAKMRFGNYESLPSIRQALNDHEVDIVWTYRSTVEREDLQEDLFVKPLYLAPLDVVVEPQHPLSERKSLQLIDLKDYPIGHLSGSINTAGEQWQDLKRNCRQQGFLPISKTVGFNSAPIWGEWYLPSIVLVFCPDCHDNAYLAERGKVVIPLEDATYELMAVCRSDDALARSLIETAVLDHGDVGAITLP